MIKLSQINNLDLPPATKKFMKSVDRIEIFKADDKTTINIYIEKDQAILISIVNVLYNAILTQLEFDSAFLKINAYDLNDKLLVETV